MKRQRLSVLRQSLCFSDETRSKTQKHPLSPVLLPVGNDGEAVRVVSVAADVRVPPGHSCRRSVILQSNRDGKNNLM